MVGVEVRVGSGLALTSIAGPRAPWACGVRCFPLATARPRGGTAAMTHAAGRMSRSPRPVRRVLGGITGRAVDGPRARKMYMAAQMLPRLAAGPIGVDYFRASEKDALGRGWGLPRVRCRFVVEIGQPERQAGCQRERKIERRPGL
jgi:hypothetical protein